MAQDVANRGEHAAKAAAEDDRYVALSKDFSRVVSLATTAAQELAAAGNRLDGFATEQSADAYNETVKQGRSALDALWAECDIVNAS
jgi:hypothetical protein